VKFSPVKKLRPNLQVPIFKIFVGWCPKKFPKVPFFFGLEGLCLAYNQKLVIYTTHIKKVIAKIY